MLGAGVVGHWVGPGQRNIPRPTEYIKVDRDAIREKDGKLSFRFMEPLEEVGVSRSGEAVSRSTIPLISMSIPTNISPATRRIRRSRLFPATTRGRPLAHGTSTGTTCSPICSRTIISAISSCLPFHGFTKLHSLELDLGEPYRWRPVWLLMHGEIEYFSATSMYAAVSSWSSQAVAPYVEALGRRREVDSQSSTIWVFPPVARAP